MPIARGAGEVWHQHPTPLRLGAWGKRGEPRGRNRFQTTRDCRPLTTTITIPWDWAHSPSSQRMGRSVTHASAGLKPRRSGWGILIKSNNSWLFNVMTRSVLRDCTKTARHSMQQDWDKIVQYDVSATMTARKVKTCSPQGRINKMSSPDYWKTNPKQVSSCSTFGNLTQYKSNTACFLAPRALRLGAPRSIVKAKLLYSMAWS